MTYIRKNFNELLENYKECIQNTHKFHSKNMVQLNKDFIEKYLPHGYNNLTEAMAAGITKHKVLPKSFNTHSKHSDLYNITDTNLTRTADKKKVVRESKSLL